ncbi:transposase, partial [Ectobacillus ponti]|uniref:transposase n=1 Tax=Ectobacillus ponti TaxID=2961894 RepID=UPI0034D1BEFC
MAKYQRYPLELKLEAVLAYLEGKQSFQTIAEKFCVSLSPLKRWVAHYREHGIEGIQRRRTCTKHTIQSKMDVLHYMNGTGASAEKTASVFNLAPSLVWTWKRLFETGGIDALQPKVKGRPSMK